MKNRQSYYSVKIEADQHTYVHTIIATSDYAAAVAVRNITGCMPRSDHDVIFLSPAPADENITR